MSRRKQEVPKKTDSEEGEDQVVQVEEKESEDKKDLGKSRAEDKAEVQEDTDCNKMPILESHEQFRSSSRSPSPPCSPPRSEEGRHTLKMKSPEELLANPMADIIKNSPFLLPAQLLALNPGLYAAQLAQLQAAQMLLAKQHLNDDENGDVSSRKRIADAECESEDENNSRNKHARSSSPVSHPPRPLDLTSSKSPDLKQEPLSHNYFNPLMPAGLLSFFNHLRPPPGSIPPQSPPSARQNNPWQAQWANKHVADYSNGRPEDVFKCVWCKESYASFEQLTIHMKEAKHHNIPNQNYRPPTSSPSRYPLGMQGPPSGIPSPPRHNPGRDILRDQIPLPRKLVRGQDVWIGRADEQTKDILKCMGCGSSFRSLELLTKHMQETQHYKKVISNDQLGSWKYPEQNATSSSPKNHVNSVLTCKVCDKAFNSLKDLSDHMVRHNHYAPSASVEPKHGQGRPPVASPLSSKERKKALPVKKLLELERARQEVAGNSAPISTREIMESGKLHCERCEEKIPIDIFIPHIQQCVGKPRFLATPSSEPVSPPSGNKDSNAGTKSEPMKEGNSSDGSSSILGSLEQLVKGNFAHSSASSSSRPSLASSPITNQAVTSFQPTTTYSSKFSINSLFPSSTPPLQHSPVTKPSSPVSSVSKSSSVNTVALPATPTLEKMLGSKEDRSRSSSPQFIKNGRKNSPRSDPSLPSSPKSDSEKEPSSPPTSKGGDNALAALQMFCNDQKKTPMMPTTGLKDSPGSPMSDPGAILAFSWACNQGNTQGSETGGTIKCPFCETPFISKGAYRHHLSKMHFTKENIGSFTGPQGPGGGLLNHPVASLPSSNRSPSPDSKDPQQSLQSKYQKYSQLAKQLSCYDGTN